MCVLVSKSHGIIPWNSDHISFSFFPFICFSYSAVKTMVRMRALQLQRECTHLCECTATIIVDRMACSRCYSREQNEEEKKLQNYSVVRLEERVHQFMFALVNVRTSSVAMNNIAQNCHLSDSVTGKRLQYKTQRRQSTTTKHSELLHSLGIIIIIHFILRKTSSTRLCDYLCVCLYCVVCTLYSVQCAVDRQCICKSYSERQYVEKPFEILRVDVEFAFIFCTCVASRFDPRISLALNSAFQVGHHISRSI